jgi:uncharacterized protein (DUF2235 family)
MPKRLVVCCDGTWSKLDQITPTNVTKLFGAVVEDGSQRKKYVEGVGARSGERFTGGAFGVGLSKHVLEAYTWLVANYEEGDELFLFGFSRGAFTARSTVGLVRNSGILRTNDPKVVDAAYSLYRDPRKSTKPGADRAKRFRAANSHPDAKIHFIGVWDTVGSLGIPFHVPVLSRLWSFHDTKLSTEVRHAYHALAIDERRGPFKPTLWQQSERATDQKLEQVWFCGVHSDVGGGYPADGLSDLSLLWMVDRAQAAGLEFAPGAFDGEHPCATGDLHESLKGPYLALWRHARGPFDADGGSPAASAARRYRDDAGYRPKGLDAYLGRHPTPTPVRDDDC